MSLAVYMVVAFFIGAILGTVVMSIIGPFIIVRLLERDERKHRQKEQ